MKFQLVAIRDLENSNIWEAKFNLISKRTTFDGEGLQCDALAGSLIITYNQKPESLRVGRKYILRCHKVYNADNEPENE